MTETTIHLIDVEGQPLRVAIGHGEGLPLLVFNGIGANLELLEPLTQALDGVETIVFDVPGVGGSQRRLSPYRLRSLAKLAEKMLGALGYVCVGRRPWRLVGRRAGPAVRFHFPFVMARLLNPLRYKDPLHLERVAPHIYGGEVRRNPRLVRDYGARSKAPNWLGYLYQQAAFLGRSSLPWLPQLSQPHPCSRREGRPPCTSDQCAHPGGADPPCTT